MAGDDFTLMAQGPTLGLFKLRLSDFWLWSHIELRGIHTFTFRSSSHSGGSGFSWPAGVQPQQDPGEPSG